MTLKLKGKQLEGLQQSLLKAFPNKSTLTQMVLFELDENLDAIAGAGPLADVVFLLIQWAIGQGRLEDLIVGARQNNAGNPDLKACALEIGMSSGEPQELGDAITGQLEALVIEGVGVHDVANWRRNMRGVEAAVCRVEQSDGEPVGTGFLLGPGVVMTNGHVVEKIELKIGTPQVRFDFLRDEAGPGAADGMAIPLMEGNWELVNSPPDVLDYALLKLAVNAGEHEVDGRKRGWLKPDGTHEFVKDEPILIVQHPEGDPLCMSAGYLRDLNNFTKRIAYTVNTEPGSSGSPCFSLAWDLIAIHHHGDEFVNHGIPMNVILSDLEDRGMDGMIG